VATREQLRDALVSHRFDFDRFGVRRLSLFGSVERGDDRPDSDVDVLVEFSDDARRRGYFRRFMKHAGFLENLLGRKVDLATPAMVRRFRSNLDEDSIFV
jgi:predicted nucleotidyltransferase